MKSKFGMIHGRFQPFHLGHLDYLCKAMERCETLIIGITNPDPSLIEEEAASSHRHTQESNPYTFFQRMLMIKETLKDEGIPPERVHIVPLPIHHPDRWPYYMPKGVVHYIRVFSSWEQLKVDRMREQGLQVEVLDPGIEKEIEATEVRARMASDGNWRELLPAGVARIIDQVQVGLL